MTSRHLQRPAIVVVGASRGIGRAIAELAARDGAPVVLIARSIEGLHVVESSIKQAGGQAFSLSLDLTSRDASTNLEEFLSHQGLVCEVLVNSAGFGLRGAATSLPIGDQVGMIDVNMRALAEMTLRLLPGMVERRRGGVINMASVASFTPGPYMAMYYASKAFVRSFSEALYQETRKTGVTVTCVAPGPVSTEFLEKSGANRAALFKVLPKASPDYVAAAAWRGFKAGRRLVIPGVSAKLAILMAGMLPSQALLPLIGKLQLRGNDPCPCGSGKQLKHCCRAGPPKGGTASV
ncbi:SDR family NAD(P)-dependent oxidoreductase (plasmid) [Ensifer adhaerens]|uniref:SDR family NAD(P)-dependent oxidoreductase n=1 Tax=Ensifer adhaerens TaxID=106592 RepID=UPI001CBB9F3C|nr:SDR family NAD(P)-dependent oxidoreductase [Ensifer adhaerens]MBZ7927448.1 SDR family NAD(P)-dependent oxidoreductase [Ensifer adhaerens]UAX97875.1 SDR family NAD(P)-dependent oxidoreductase [Ensifer adhaerens]UAY05254.1 SDR family NAD(P)-dependent oxidoreductase [Ensifer adhaerens]UAY12632.1 SDR family NAD(P)-dependent oxidoreductase [Ensifer adhaerens]